jgi:hypothetical protein
MADEEQSLAGGLLGLEWSEDGYSLRTPFDGDVDGDGRHVVVGGETVVTFADSDEGEKAREAILAALKDRSPPSVNAGVGREGTEQHLCGYCGAQYLLMGADYLDQISEALDKVGAPTWSADRSVMFSLVERIAALAPSALARPVSGDVGGLVDTAFQTIMHNPAAYEEAQTYRSAILSAFASLQAALTAEKERVERAEYALAYLASCTAATAEGLLDRKSTSKYELERHRSICSQILDALRGKDIARRFSSAATVGAEARLEKVLARLSEGNAG